MKSKRIRNQFISMLLTLAMLLTLLPTAAFAADEEDTVERPASAEFKIMGLYALRDNGRRVSFYAHESWENAFLTKANMTYPDSWFKLIYVIERSQPVTLELYEMKDEPAYMDSNIVTMRYAEEDEADGHGKLQSEEFLGRRLGVLVGVPVQENVVPLQAGDDILTAEKVGYSPIDEDQWLNIIYQTISGEREPEVIEDFYAIGFEGNRLAGLDDAAAAASIADVPDAEDTAESDTQIVPEDLDMPEREDELTADIAGEQSDAQDDTADHVLAAEPSDVEPAEEAAQTAEAMPAAETAEQTEPVENARSAEEEAPSAEMPDAEEPDGEDLTPVEVEEETAVEMPEEDALPVTDDVSEPENAEEIDYLPESSVLPSAHAFFDLTDAAETGENTIQNIVLWDGSYRDDNGDLTRISSGGRYVIVMQPCTPRTAIYNSFLGFDVPDKSEAVDTFQTINSWDALINIRDELACSGDPVDLLSGSFTWNYRDLALYGKDDLEFTRYYESIHADENYGLGNG